MPTATNGIEEAATTPVEQAMAAIADYLEKIRFGSIAITIHDGKVVQLDVTEKRRLAR